MSKFDAIIIGAGHNGLIADATLSKAGLRTLVLESRAEIGGMATTVEIHPGFKVPAISHLLYNLSPLVIKELKLDKHGLKYAAENLPTLSLANDGRHVQLYGADASFSDGSPHPDAKSFAEIQQKLSRFSAALAPALAKTPPKLAGGGMRELLGFTSLGFGFLRLGRTDLREMLRIVLSNIDDLLRDEMADGPLPGAFAFDAALGSFSAPRSPGSVLVAMYRLAHGGKRHQPLGGMGAVTTAMASAAKAEGGEIRTGCRVGEILIEQHKISGVRLESGEVIQAKLVMSNLDGKSTLALTGNDPFDVETTRRIGNVRTKATAAKLNLALKARPKFDGLSDIQHQGRIVIAPSMMHIEQAFNNAKYGEMSKHPVMEITIPSLADKTLVEGEGHVLSAIVQYAPYNLKGGWNDAERKRLEQIAIATLEYYAPGIGKLIIASQMLTPADIEAEYGASGGHWHHGELAADQMAMMRPVNLMGRYNMAVPGLYLCGASAHPGGDVMGLAGRNAARRALKDRGRV
jgi:phytoene dehydrogenase-like protein